MTNEAAGAGGGAAGRPSEDEYQTLCAALSASARGRAFLAEYARRNRHADTEVLLAAIERLEARMRADASRGAAATRRPAHAADRHPARRGPRSTPRGPAAKAVKLSALLDLLERRIDAMAEPKPAAPSPPRTKTQRHARRGAGARRARIADPSPAANFEPRPVAAVARAPAVIGKPDPLAAIMALSEDERPGRCLLETIHRSSRRPGLGLLRGLRRV